jgi:hypothetical protein
VSRQAASIVRTAREFLHAAAQRVEGARFLVRDLDHLYVGARCVARRMGANVVVSETGLLGSETLYPSEGVDELVTAIRVRLEVCHA